MPFTAHGSLHSKFLPLPVTASLLAVALIYLWGWYRLRTPKMPYAWQLAAFMSGVFALWTVVGSPFAALDHRLLTAHMVQHLLIMTVAAPLLLLGAPVVAARNRLPCPPGKEVLRHRHSAVHRLGSIVAHPVFCWLASTTAVVAWHIPAVFELGLQSESWHAVEQVCFLAAGLLFWWPVIQPLPSLARSPRWAVPLYLFLATLPCDALAAFLAFCNRVVYRHYLYSGQAFSISALGDQERAGALMWVWVTFAYLAPATALTIRLLSSRETEYCRRAPESPSPDSCRC